MSHLASEPLTTIATAAAFPRFAGSATRRALRLRPRTVVWVVLGGLAAYVLLPQLETLRGSLAVLADVHPGWVLAGLGLVAIRYAMATVSLQVAVNRAIPFGPTLSVQLASSFIGRLTPEGVGWLVLNQRYLERSGLERPSALAGITLKVLAGAVMRLLIAVGVAAAVGATGLVRVELPGITPFLLALGLLGVLGAAALSWAVRARARRVLAPVIAGARDLAAVLRKPRRTVALFGSTAALTIASGLALWTSVMAVGAGASVIDVFAVYLGGTAIAALSPTPGNIGAVEVALGAGLSAIGIPPDGAVAAVLLYRLLTFWLPILPGFLAFRSLQGRALL